MLLRGHIGFGMLLVWNQLAPAMTVQQVVGGGQRDLAPQANIHRSFDLADHQDAALLGLLEERGQQGQGDRAMWSLDGLTEEQA